jgi:hypothetical protein
MPLEEFPCNLLFFYNIVSEDGEFLEQLTRIFRQRGQDGIDRSLASIGRTLTLQEAGSEDY